MTLEVRIPISPHPAWLIRTRLIMASIRELYPDAIFRISVGTHHQPSREEIAHVESAIGQPVMWLSPDLMTEWRGTRSEYLATMMDRYRAPFRGDHILMLDADVLCTTRFDELFEYDAIQGVQAHHSPYGAAGWQLLFKDFGWAPPRLAHEYSAFGIMEHNAAERFGPFYPNSGVVFGPRHLFERLSKPFDDAIQFLRGCVTDTYWFDQVGFALGIEQARIPVRTLPLRYNFPNRPAFDAARPAELADVRFLHAMQTDIVDRDRDFEDVAALRRLVGRTDLVGSNAVLRQRVGSLMRVMEPASLMSAEDAPWA